MAEAGLAAGLRSDAWRSVLAPALAAPSSRALEAFLAGERAGGHRILPPGPERFAALDLVEPERVRVVILGQDPYPTPGHAHGLAFSYRGPGPLPRSLANVLREVEADVGGPARSGDLRPWARQGVLLLNTVLSVRAGAAGSHRRRGWEPLTEAVLRHLARRPRPPVFVLWGADARRRRALLGAGPDVLEAGHPSPLSVRHFRGCRHFSAVNACLGPPPIDWRLPRGLPCPRP